MGKKLARQIRITGVSRAGIRVFAALDVPVNLKTDLRDSGYLAFRAKALQLFRSKHPGARVTELRSMVYLENDRAW